MVTSHSIDLKRISEECFAAGYGGGCKILIRVDDGCGTYKCPFYKPKQCKDWVRIEDRTGINIIPPEEAFR